MAASGRLIRFISGTYSSLASRVGRFQLQPEQCAAVSVTSSRRNASSATIQYCLRPLAGLSRSIESHTMDVEETQVSVKFVTKLPDVLRVPEDVLVSLVNAQMMALGVKRLTCMRV